MLVETFLRVCAKSLTQRYLAFEEYSHNLLPQPKQQGRYLLYIHIPFCEELCPYCAFMRVKMEHSLARAYFDALKKEIEIYRDCGYCFDSVYVGGGTPTIMPEELGQIISFVRDTWPIKQVSVETNPNHLAGDHLRILKDVGTNRLSVGVQSFDNKILESIQRLDKYGCGEGIREKICSVMGMFDTVNIDMIFNFPNQTEEMLVQDVEIVKEIGADQVTYYPLIVSDVRKKELARKCGKVSYHKEKRLYKLITERLGQVYSQESAWCFSSEQGVIDEYILNHDEYAGLGAGSWGYINGAMYSNTFSIRQYIQMLRTNSHPIVSMRRFSRRERVRYDFFVKLIEGTLSLSAMSKKYGERFWLYLLPELAFFLTIRAAKLRDGKIVLTSRGRYYWVVLMRTLFAVVGDHRGMRLCSDGASSE